MLSVSNLSVQFGKRVLFDEVNVTFTQGNCYGIIGANGAGKSTFLKILSGKQEPTSGRVILEPGKRMSVLEQDHYAYDDYTVLDTVIMGNKVLSKIKKEMDDLYADYSDEHAERIGELQIQFDEMNGWNAESDAAALLSNLGITEDMHYTMMSEMDGKLKVRVLLAQALFGNPDVLIMDEPTNGLDIPSKALFRKVIAGNLPADSSLIISTHQVHDVEQLLDHVFVLNNSEMIINASVEEIAKEYEFTYRNANEMDENVLYAEPSLQGNAVIARRKADSPETTINLELLFNAATLGKLNNK